jgi:hypothetical protein
MTAARSVPPGRSTPKTVQPTAAGTSAGRLAATRPRKAGCSAITASRSVATGSRSCCAVERVLYHPEAIAIKVSPASALAPVLSAARDATREVLGASAAEDGKEWAPHLTLRYSAGEQPAAPVIAELGTALPAREVTIGDMSLVVQDGPEQSWNWRVAGTARLLGGPGSARHREESR